MGNPNVQAARRERRQAEKDQKAAELRAEAAAIRGDLEEGERAEADAAEVLERLRLGQRGYLRIPSEDGVIRVVTADQFEALTGQIEQAGQRLRAAAPKLAKARQGIATYVQNVNSRLEALEAEMSARQDALANAQADTHGYLEGVAGDWSKVVGALSKYGAPIIKLINAGDYQSNPQLVTTLEVIDELAEDTSSSEMKELLGVLKLAVTAWSYNHPDRPLTSIFLPGDTRDTSEAATTTTTSGGGLVVA